VIDWALSQSWNGPLALLLYWLPLAFCVYGYTARTWVNYRKDRAKRDGDGYYVPTDTVGDVLGRALMVVIPFANLLAAAFDLGPEVFGRFFAALARVFNQPLVPKRPSE